MSGPKRHMIVWILVGLVMVVLLFGFRRMRQDEWGTVTRSGRKTGRILAPGFHFVIPMIERVQIVSVVPLSVSLPPQSAITSDEIPIQLQASLDAAVVNPKLAVDSVRDWRIHLMGYLQGLMKDRLEDLDFDSLQTSFPAWTIRIREQLDQEAKRIGVEIRSLQISNLSPRSRPV